MKRNNYAYLTEPDGHIDLAYAVTTTGAQGASASYSITLSGTEGGRKGMATRESAYVGGSRHKEHHQSYTDDREGWLKPLDRQADRYSAHDLLHHDADRAAQVAGHRRRHAASGAAAGE